MDNIPPLAPNGLDEIVARYGDPKIRIVGGDWQVDSAWESANLATLRHALLPNGKIYAHRLVHEPMGRLLDRWAARIAAGDPYRVKTFGCFAPRAQRGGSKPSTHTWAIAFDLNAASNRLVSPRDAGPLIKDIPDPWIADAVAEGWFWGGSFQHRFDPMHFQLATGF